MALQPSSLQRHFHHRSLPRTAANPRLPKPRKGQCYTGFSRTEIRDTATHKRHGSNRENRATARAGNLHPACERPAGRHVPLPPFGKRRRDGMQNRGGISKPKIIWKSPFFAFPPEFFTFAGFSLCRNLQYNLLSNIFA